MSGTVHPYIRYMFIPPHPHSQPKEQRHSNDITSPNTEFPNHTSGWDQSYNANLGLSNPSMTLTLPKTMVLLSLGLVESCLDQHFFWKDRGDWDIRRRENIGINIAVTIKSPLQEEDRIRCSTKVWPNLLTRKCWDAEGEEAQAEAAVDCTDSIRGFTPSITVSWLQ